MANTPKKATSFTIHVPGSSRAEASFKFESGDLKDEGRIDSDSVREYEISEPGKLRLSAISLAPRSTDEADE